MVLRCLLPLQQPLSTPPTGTTVQCSVSGSQSPCLLPVSKFCRSRVQFSDSRDEMATLFLSCALLFLLLQTPWE